MVHGPFHEVIPGPSLLDWSTDQGSVFSGHSIKQLQEYGNNELCMDHRNKIKVPDPVVKDVVSKKLKNQIR